MNAAQRAGFHHGFRLDRVGRHFKVECECGWRSGWFPSGEAAFDRHDLHAADARQAWVARHPR